MTTCRRTAAAGGFTLIEVIVVLAVLGVLLGTAVPLAGAVVQADRRQEAQRELVEVGAALHAYWYDNASFPASLSATDFVGVYLQPGPQNTAIIDAFADLEYRYAVNAGTQVATVYSVGENGVDDGVGNEELVTQVFASVPGTRRSWQRLRIIVEVLANHIEVGGSVTGDWATVRSAVGLGASYQVDGWGTPLRWTSATHTLSSAGPDRRFDTADDITI